jgi:hypothetical protein
LASPTIPKAATADPKDFFDNGFLKELESSGFVKELYPKDNSSFPSAFAASHKNPNYVPVA